MENTETQRRYGKVFGEDIRFDAPVAEDLTESAETAETDENTAPIESVVQGEG